jgi:dTDP-4-amino-4,6-dideoxygalactose transaminase
MAKNAMSELAVVGGQPEFEYPLHVGQPNVGDRNHLLARMSEMLDRKWLTNHGPFVQELEAKIAKFVGVRHCVAMCNGTVALEIAIRALGLTGEVIVPSFTFIATAHALQWQEITPVFCDVDPKTHTIDPGKLERLITPRTTGIIGVHTWGHACDVDTLETIARDRKLHLMFDAAHAFGCSYRGKPIGGLGHCEVFSFHATKVFNTFEGGAIATNDDALAHKLRLMRNFGFSDSDKVIYIGTNGKMTEASAAMGLTSLESLPEFIEMNRRNYESYRQELANLPGIEVFPYDRSEQNNYQYVVCEVDKQRVGLTRDQLVAILIAENVLARRYFYPGCHRMEPYRSYFPMAGLVLPETENLCQRVMVLPNGTAIDESALARICSIIRIAVANASELEPHLAGASVTPLARPPSSARSPE